MEVKDWLLLGALAIGGYFVYTTFVKPITDLAGGTEDAVHLATTPGYQLIGEWLSEVKLPELPGVSLPDVSTTATGVKTILPIVTNPFTMVGLLTQPKQQPLGTNTTKQIQQNANTRIVRASTPIYNTPGRVVALDTSAVHPYTAPAQQIETYQTSKRIIKVGGVSKKVM